jgi:hypothetical protein
MGANQAKLLKIDKTLATRVSPLPPGPCQGRWRPTAQGHGAGGGPASGDGTEDGARV